MPKKETFHPCAVKQLEGKKAEAAAERAIAENPTNKPTFGVPATLIAMTGILEPQKLDVRKPPEAGALTALVSRYFGKGGVSLTVSFMERTARDLAGRIVEHMNAWKQYGNINFTLVDTDGDVRISRKRGGYWSYLGTDIYQIPKNQPTMNLEGFSMQTPESEFRRVVRHETGHTLGFPHEHMREEIIKRLDPNKTIAYFMRTQGWSQQDVVAQVLTPLEKSQLLFVPGFEQPEDASIMTYSLPAAITVDGRPIVGGKDITTMDGAYVGAIYPKEPIVTPPPPGVTIIKLEIQGQVTSVKLLEGPTGTTGPVVGGSPGGNN